MLLQRLLKAYAPARACSALTLSTSGGLERKVYSAARAASAGREAILGDSYALQGKAVQLANLLHAFHGLCLRVASLDQTALIEACKYTHMVPFVTHFARAFTIRLHFLFERSHVAKELERAT